MPFIYYKYYFQKNKDPFICFLIINNKMLGAKALMARAAGKKAAEDAKVAAKIAKDEENKDEENKAILIANFLEVEREAFLDGFTSFTLDCNFHMNKYVDFLEFFAVQGSYNMVRKSCGSGEYFYFSPMSDVWKS